MKKAALWLFLVVWILSWNQISLGQNKINLGLNVKQFRFNADTSLVEIYYGIISNTFENRTENSQYALELTINAENRNLIRNIWRVENQINSSDSSKARVNVDVLRYLLVPGKYNFRLIAKDLLNPERIDSVKINDFLVRKNDPHVLSLSDIELSHEIVPVARGQEGKFVKNRFRVVPSVLNYYDPQNANICYYLEIYRVKEAISGKYFRIKRTVLNSDGLPVPEIPAYTKKKRIRGNDDIEVGMFDSKSLPSGKYHLQLAVVDSAGQTIAAQIVPFYVNNPAIHFENVENMTLEEQMARSEIALIDASQLDMLLGALKYLVTEGERKIIDNLQNEEAKRLYLFRYWKADDNTPETNSLESFRDFVWRVQFANTNFTDIRMPGWKSDRGRVLILYGKPSEIQYYPNVPDFKEFQAWSYDEIENGVVFIFGVIGGFGNLKLLHSTKTGEMHNEGWLDLLKVSHGRTGIAEETMGVDAKEYLRNIFRVNNLEWPRYLK